MRKTTYGLYRNRSKVNGLMPSISKQKRLHSLILRNVAYLGFLMLPLAGLGFQAQIGSDTATAAQKARRGFRSGDTGAAGARSGGHYDQSDNQPGRRSKCL
jgi:hypothetical protein